MIAAKVYAAFVDGEPVAHVGVSTKSLTLGTGHRLVAVEARASRLVVMPEWQGAGLGMRFLNHVAELQRTGAGVLPDRRMTTLFHSSHPQLCAALRRDPRWRQRSASLYGGKKESTTAVPSGSRRTHTGYGGHFRAVQGFRYYGTTT
jgi:GNAT superfamily N-acetyltransferase